MEQSQPISDIMKSIHPFLEYIKDNRNLCFLHYGQSNSGKYDLFSGKSDENFITSSLSYLYETLAGQEEFEYNFSVLSYSDL